MSKNASPWIFGVLRATPRRWAIIAAKVESPRRHCMASEACITSPGVAENMLHLLNNTLPECQESGRNLLAYHWERIAKPTFKMPEFMKRLKQPFVKGVPEHHDENPYHEANAALAATLEADGWRLDNNLSGKDPQD